MAQKVQSFAFFCFPFYLEGRRQPRGCCSCPPGGYRLTSLMQTSRRLNVTITGIIQLTIGDKHWQTLSRYIIIINGKGPGGGGLKWNFIGRNWISSSYNIWPRDGFNGNFWFNFLKYFFDDWKLLLIMIVGYLLHDKVRASEREINRVFFFFICWMVSHIFMQHFFSTHTWSLIRICEK